jgi:hypothetical protein
VKLSKQEGDFDMRLISKGAAVFGMMVLLTALPVQADEPSQLPLIAQNNPFNNVDDGFHSLIIDTIRMLESAKEAMKSNDPEVKRMAEETYNLGMQQLQSMMPTWMKKNPFRTTSPR